MSPITHDNHYVPIWYQRRFLATRQASFYHLDLHPPTIDLPGGRSKLARTLESRYPKGCFVEHDLYTTVLGGAPNDEIERYLFGEIDDNGARAVRALVENDLVAMHTHFLHFFEYLSTQKVRTPKGLDWIRRRYPALSQIELMVEMQALRRMHCTMWLESVREIVSAEDSEVKFVVTDHPVTTYNAACPPASQLCQYPEDPPISLIGTQTLFALDATHCLILTNLEYAKSPGTADLLKERTNARYGGQTISRTDKMIRTRKLNRDEVIAMNHVLKARARRFVAASEKGWLQPEAAAPSWGDIAQVLLPKTELYHFGGDIYIGHKDGSVQYQDAFGHTSRSHEYLRKEQRQDIGPDDRCGCGSGRKLKKCCGPIPLAERAQWTHLSIRERNLMFLNAIVDILGLNKGKTWTDVRRELSDAQVKRIHQVLQAGWPKDSNIVELLPRPDRRVWRAVYIGLIDPRTIEAAVTGWLAYFDEIVVIHPFVNPNYVRPEYSPTESPGKHKSQTLKNVLTLLKLEPFIRAGMIHLIPDPGEVNFEYMHAAMSMARARGASWEPSKEDMRQGMLLAKDDFKRARLRMSEESLASLMRKSTPKVTDEQLARAVQFAKHELEQDPLALLQPVVPGEAGAEYNIMRGVSLETGMFLAQLTGAALYTDSHAHWVQLNEHTSVAKRPDNTSEWLEVVRAAAEAEWVTEIHPGINVQIREGVKLGYVRRFFLRLWNTIQHAGADKSGVSQDLATRLSRVADRAARDWQGCCASTLAPSMRIRWQLELAIPQNGFGANTVHRLLVTFGRTGYVKPVPMAMFVKPIVPDEYNDE